MWKDGRGPDLPGPAASKSTVSRVDASSPDAPGYRLELLPWLQHYRIVWQGNPGRKDLSRDCLVWIGHAAMAIPYYPPPEK